MRHFLLGFFLLIPGSSLFSQSSPPLTAFTEEFPPFNYQSQGIAEGFAVEALALLAQKAGVEPQIQFVPWARAMEETQKRRNTLIFTMALTEERKPLYRWILKISDRISVLYRLTTREDLRTVSLENLKTSGTFAVVKNDPAGSLLRRLGIPPRQIHEIQDLPDRSRTALAVELGHDDFFISPPMLHRFEVSRGTRKDVFFPHLVLTREDGLYIAGSLDFDPEILSRLKRAALTLEASGELRQLRSRYLTPEEE